MQGEFATVEEVQDELRRRKEMAYATAH